MKFNILSRSETEYTRARRDDPLVIQRDLDPQVHPFQQEREYARALKAAKLERHFARPFIGALEGHVDGIWCLATHPRNLVALLSGACDGVIRLWDLPSKSCMWERLGAHEGFVRGLSVCHAGTSFVSCGEDRTVKLWSLLGQHARSSESAFAGMQDDEDFYDEDSQHEALLETYSSENPFLGIDTHWSRDEIFATCGEELAVWDKSRPEPVHKYTWGGMEGMAAIKFNPAEVSLLATCGKSDRSIMLYDFREKTAIKKIVQPMRNNNLAWNPMEPYHFTTANEDFNLYTFDMRKMDKALVVHKDHVSAVIDVHYSPTGREFVSASYDKSIRIFSSGPGWQTKGRSREVYTAPRMQRCFSCRFSLDSHFVFSGSDDGNIRLWKSRASQVLGVLPPKQKRSLEYNRALLKKFGNMEEVRKISTKRILPKLLFKETKKLLEMKEAQRRKKIRMKNAGLKNIDETSAKGKAVLRGEKAICGW